MMKTMTGSKFCITLYLLLVVSWAIPGSAESVAKPQTLSDPALEAVLHKQIEPDEGVQLQYRVKAELEPSLPGEEQVVVWTLLGPAYWSNHLSVLSQQNGQWRLLATLSLGGAEVKLETVTSDGLISVNAKTPGPNDPVCCPSQQKNLQYRYGYGQLVEANTDSPSGKQP